MKKNTFFGAVLFLSLFLFAGCAAITKSAKTSQIEDLNQQITRLEETILKKDEMINNLHNELQEKDAMIEKLKKKLSSFGVFE